MKKAKALLSWILALCLMITPFSGSILFASAAEGPVITFSIAPYAYVNADDNISVSYEGDIATCEITLEGTVISSDPAGYTFIPAVHGATDGVYTLVAKATDTAGLTTIATRIFTVNSKTELTYTINGGSVTSNDGDVTVYNATALAFEALYGTTTDGNIDLTSVQPHSADMFVYNRYGIYAADSTLTSVSGIPYEAFDVDLAGATTGTVNIHYAGTTHDGERIAVKVYNPTTAAWDTLGSFVGNGYVSENVDIATYNDNGEIHIAAVLDYVTNGSDTMIWSTDPQHYTKFEDLYDYYYKVYQYAAEEYLAGNAGYILTTGDLVDDRPNSSAAAKQWEVSDQAMQYIEAVGMPNGLVSGNHDVGDNKKPDYSAGLPNSDYSKFWETFPASRYNNQPWFGGSLNNNVSHYDLITIGNVDFIVMYLGYGLEATDETIVWANEVLQTYSHRTAIITTHEYLDAGAAIRSTASRAQLIFDKIVDPNPNVKAILCGHDDGSLCLEKTASDGRTVYEILCDYQFVEAEDPSFYENEHYIGSVPHCCGDGYIRLMTVEGDTLSSVTYSPVTGRYNPYGDREKISIDLDCGAADRYIQTNAFSCSVLGTETTTPTDTWVAAITNGDRVSYSAAQFTSYPDIDLPVGGFDRCVDYNNYLALRETAEAMDLSVYTTETASVVEGLLAEDPLASINPGNQLEVTQKAYVDLAEALGALKLYVEPISREGLATIHNYDFTLTKWRNNDASVPITSTRSYITATATDAGGIRMEKSSVATNTWPSAKYTTTNIALKPVNGKIYVDLDVNADSAWCIYLEVAQANKSAAVRLNFAIENAFNSITSDGFQGHFKGVYDVTEAFTKNGLDVNATMTIKNSLLYIVPGGVTYDHIELLTETTAEPVDKSALAELVSDAKALDETLYTPSTWTALEAALPAAEVALIDPSATQSDINLEIIKLQLVLDKMKLVADVVVEPEGSLIPGDEGLWIPNIATAMNIYRNEDNYTVLQNTNSEWPYADYTYPEEMVVTVADHQISFDITVGSATNIHVNFDNQWISLSKFISAANTSGEDLGKGTYVVDVPLSSIPALASKETVTLRKTRVYSVGAAADSAVTIRKMQVTDYIAPPPVADDYISFMPETMDDTSTAATAGSHELYANDLYIRSDAENGYRMQIIKDIELYDLTKLNAIRMNVESEVPFKIAFNIKSYNDETSQWFTTSDAPYSHLYTVENDRVAAGSYDVCFDILANTTAIQDKTSVYMVSVTIVTTGEGQFRLKDLEAIHKDLFQWPDGITYGAPATPDKPYAQHCAQDAPRVAEKVDLLSAIDLTEHPTITGWCSYGNQTLGLEIDLNKTPYLYYSVAVPAESNFCFSLYNNSNYSPWLMFRDGTMDGAALNKDAANWDAYTNREQYITTSETGCIDMRQYLKTSTLKWVVNAIAFYNSTGKSDVISYMFFGSAPLPDPEPGDVDGDGTINMADATALYNLINGKVEPTKENSAYADVNNDGKVDAFDALILYNVVSGALPADTIDSYHTPTT